MRSTFVSNRTMACLAAALVVGLGAGAMRAADQSETLVYAVYDGQDTAGQVFQSMKNAQRDTGERIE